MNKWSCFEKNSRDSMNTNNIKAYAPKARFEFMSAVANRLSLFGITANQKGEIQVSEAERQGSVVLIGGNSFDVVIAAGPLRYVVKAEKVFNS